MAYYRMDQLIQPLWEFHDNDASDRILPLANQLQLSYPRSESWRGRPVIRYRVNVLSLHRPIDQLLEVTTGMLILKVGTPPIC